MKTEVKEKLIEWAEKYNDPFYFSEDPIAFPREFAMKGAGKQDIEVASVFAAHFAWGRRAMIVRDLTRFFDFIEWKPLDYVLSGEYRSDKSSIHRTITWEETAAICSNLRNLYTKESTLEKLSVEQIRCNIFGQKPDKRAPNKKINMMRRWMVRKDGRVDLGLWKDTSPSELVIPLDIHVYDEAKALALTNRQQKDLGTAIEITEAFRQIFPDDPCLGDFALFGYGVTKK